GLPYPRLGQLSRCCGICRAPDEFRCAFYRLLHPAPHLRPSTCRTCDQIQRLMPMLGRSIRQNSTILGIFALATAGVIALIDPATPSRIADAQYRAPQKALLEIVPADRHNNDLLGDTITLDSVQLEALGIKTDETGYLARMDGIPVAVILPSVAPDGYSGDIRMIVGVNRDGTVAGVRVLNHRETPGLGDKLELAKSSWILGFDGKSLGNPELDRW